MFFNQHSSDEESFDESEEENKMSYGHLSVEER